MHLAKKMKKTEPLALGTSPESNREPLDDVDSTSTDDWLWSRCVVQSIDHGGDFVRRHLPGIDLTFVIDALEPGYGHGRDFGIRERHALQQLSKKHRSKSKPCATCSPFLTDEQDWREVVVGRWEGLGSRA